MRPYWQRVVLGVTLLVLWAVLAKPLTLQEIVIGVLVTVVIVALPLPGRSVYGEIIATPRRVLYSLAYVGVFLWAVVRSNLDVAFRVLNPDLPINPGIVRVKTKLKSRIGRLLLANSITLTPGTISVAINGEDIYIHWINVGAADVENSTKKIVTDFERYLEVSFG